MLTAEQLKTSRKRCDEHEMIPSGYYLNLLDHIDQLEEQLAQAKAENKKLSERLAHLKLNHNDW